MAKSGTTHKQFVKLYAQELECSEADAARYLKAFTDVLLGEMNARQKVTIQHLGGFYVEEKKSSTAFRFNPSQRLKAILGWSSTYTGVL